MSFIPNVQQKFDANNSTTGILYSAESFTGTATDVSLYNTITINAFADVDSEINGLSLKFSNDMETWSEYNNYTVIGNIEKTINIEVIAKYFKLSYLAAWNNQSVFRLQTILSPSPKIPNFLSQLSSDAQGNLNVNAKNNPNLTLIDQLDFSYGFDSNKVTKTVTNSGDGYAQTGYYVLACNGSPGSCKIKSKPTFDGKFGQSALVKFAMTFDDATSQVSKYVGVGDENNGYFFGYNLEGVFGILHRTNSYTYLVENFIPQHKWIYNQMNGLGGNNMTLNVSKGNVYQIVYPLIGYGNINFYIMNEYGDEFILVHTIKGVNTYVKQLVRNPTMTLCAEIISNINANSKITINSMQQYIECLQIPKYDSLLSYSTFKTNDAESRYLFSIKNMNVFWEIPNTSCIKLKSMSVYWTTTNAINLRIILNGTLFGDISYVNISDKSIAQYENSGSDISGGIQIYNVMTGPGIIDLENSGIIVKPNDVITFIAEPLGIGSINISIALNWIESTF